MPRLQEPSTLSASPDGIRLRGFTDISQAACAPRRRCADRALEAGRAVIRAIVDFELARVAPPLCDFAALLRLAGDDELDAAIAEAAAGDGDFAPDRSTCSASGQDRRAPTRTAPTCAIGSPIWSRAPGSSAPAMQVLCARPHALFLDRGRTGGSELPSRSGRSAMRLRPKIRNTRLLDTDIVAKTRGMVTNKAARNT